MLRFFEYTDESGKIREYNADSEREWPDGISRL